MENALWRNSDPPRWVNFQTSEWITFAFSFTTAQQPTDGLSFLDTLTDPAAPEYRTTQYFEMHGNR